MLLILSMLMLLISVILLPLPLPLCVLSIVVLPGVGNHGPGQHELPAQGIHLHHLLLQDSTPATRPPQLLDPICVLERVEGVLAAGAVGGNVADHHGATVAGEGVLQDHGELAASEGRVVFVLVEGPNALLQGE